MWNLVLSAALLGAAADFEALSLDGKSAVGQIASLDTQRLVLRTAEGDTTFPLGTLATLSRLPAKPADERKVTLWVELVDGSGLAATDYTVQGGMAKVTLSLGAGITLPTRAIQWVRFAPPAAGDAKLNEQWSGIVRTEATGDLLVVRKNGALDYLEGVQGDIDAETCSFELDKEVIPVKRPKVEGIIYFHPTTAELPEAIGQLITVDGSRLVLRSIDLAGEALKITTPGVMSIGIPLELVARCDFSSGKIAYLSDLPVESASYVPFLGLKEAPAALTEFYHFRRDESFEQNPLRLDGKVYRKGLSLQSRSVLSYKLPGKFRIFKAIAGIDDSVRETGNVHLEIKGDGKILWQGEVRGADAPHELEVDVAGVKRLEILVDYGADLDIGDRLDLCEARVTK
jgi:hypothetical protein